MFAKEALLRLLEYPEVYTILDIGSGAGEQAAAFRAAGKQVTTISISPPADYQGDYLTFKAEKPFDAVWASHVLEHQPNVGLFLRKCFNDLRDGGILAVTVPPLKHEIVGGHVALFNAGILIYNLILAGFDCSKARVSPIYTSGCPFPYNISVIVRKKEAKLPDLVYDNGDIERIAHFFPIPMAQNYDGRFTINW